VPSASIAQTSGVSSRCRLNTRTNGPSITADFTEPDNASINSTRVSFFQWTAHTTAIDDPEMGVKSLLLHRTLFYEELMDEEERGVKVSLEGDEYEQDYLNVLNSIKIRPDEVEIISLFREYQLDTSTIEKSVIQDMVELLKKQNYDNRFTIHIA
jgi:glycogen debranching enzyme